MFARPMNLCIDSKAFASLILDYEFPENEFSGPYVSCRVLIEDLLYGYVTASSRDEAITKFRNGEWKK